MKKQTRVTCYDITEIRRRHPAPNIFGLTSFVLFTYLVTAYVTLSTMRAFAGESRTIATMPCLLESLILDGRIPHLNMHIRDRNIATAFTTYVQGLYRSLDALFEGSDGRMPVPVEFGMTCGVAVKELKLRTLGVATLLTFTRVYQ